jgi:inner membrane protein
VDPLTHTAAGVAISRLIPTPARKWGLVAGFGFALLPDIDFLWLFLDRLSYIRYHRGFTHSILALGLFALLGACIGRRLGGSRWFRPLFVLGLAVLASHLLLDVATSYGTQIFSPFSRQKFSLDWLFIIDPYFTLILLIGAVGAWFAPAKERLLVGVSLTLAGMYFLLCGLYHHQALALGRQIFTDKESATIRVAALPQPFSCRRWHLLAVSPEEVKQTMVGMTVLGFLRIPREVNVAESTWAPGANPHAPPLPYRPPHLLLVQKWQVSSPPVQAYAPDAARILDTFLDFARFPLLSRWEWRKGGLSLQFLDLRFTIPGRAYPFVLELLLAEDGRLRSWQWGRSGLWKK